MLSMDLLNKNSKRKEAAGSSSFLFAQIPIKPDPSAAKVLQKTPRDRFGEMRMMPFSFQSTAFRMELNHFIKRTLIK